MREFFYFSPPAPHKIIAATSQTLNSPLKRSEKDRVPPTRNSGRKGPRAVEPAVQLPENL
ncbi:hypothetical protein FXV91_13750 [Methanosarcina sp. DH2]|uniref:hypothetical protein n=1 Tax=Methanosarcina sp. DH2 TaxID=2605639 RepID=UPI001E3E7709|nr:hypothetical protein [Methanosarcina sp. DH2]MCC4771190.1 hypothetical protein [Methanosarcina sp. DH2]